MICSWDVGITHLAYCIMEYCPENKEIPYKIYKWDNINLTNNQEYKCSQELKNKKKCNGNAKYITIVN